MERVFTSDESHRWGPVPRCRVGRGPDRDVTGPRRWGISRPGPCYVSCWLFSGWCCG